MIYFIFFGVVTFTAGIYPLYKRYIKFKNYPETVGRIVEYNGKNPIVEFYANGQNYRTVGAAVHANRDQIGETRKVKYNPNDPTKNVLPLEASEIPAIVIMTSIGLLFFAAVISYIMHNY